MGVGPAGDCLALWIVRLVEVAGHAQGRTPDGTDGEEVEEAVQESQGGPLQAPGQEDQEDDPKGQTPCRANASQAAKQPVFLVAKRPIQAGMLKKLD